MKEKEGEIRVSNDARCKKQDRLIPGNDFKILKWRKRASGEQDPD